MPKERLHLYLADEFLNRCATLRFPSSPRQFYIGAISPDIFYYDLPGFSLSPVGNELHDIIDRKGFSIIYDWIAQSCPPACGDAEILWGLGFACHFLVDAAWHPVINELSRLGPGLWAEAGKGEQEEKFDAETGRKIRRGENALNPAPKRSLVSASDPSRFPAARCCTSEIDCHRLIESELESLWLARSPRPEKYDRLLEELRNDRAVFFEIASFYGEFLKFVGLEVSEARIVRCFLKQNFFLRFFANKMLGRQRDRLLSFPPTRFLGALVTPARPFLPALFSRILQEDGNPFSDCFMEKAIDFIETNLCH